MWYSLASYAALATLGLLAIRYYNPQFFSKFRSTATASPQTSTEHKPAKKQKSKKAKPSDEKASSAPTSRSEAPSKKRKIISPPASKSINANTRQEDDDDEVDNSMSNKELAQQLAQVQAGVKLEKKQAGHKESRRTVAPSTLKAQQTLAASPSLSAETSSTGGRDADDDLSPNDTPPLSVPLTAGTSLAGDVSDMLEPAGPAPKTLRITDVKVAEKKQARRNYEPVLTKKQKQRQKIQEENRRLKEESDRLHEAKKQQQLTTARLAAGTSNQTKANSFAAATQNAWQKQSEDRPGQAQTQPQPQPLLDTFETDKRAVAAKTDNPVAAAVPEQVAQTSAQAVAALGRQGRPGISKESSWAEQVNEDAQNEWEKSLVEDESWEPVTSKKSKKKNRKDTDTSSEASAAISKFQAQGTTNGGRKDSFGAKSQHGINGDNRFASIEELNGDSWEA